MEELNKKIAERVGFKFDKIDYWSGVFGNIKSDVLVFYNKSKDGDWEIEKLFTDSLDACFKYVVPQFFQEFGKVALEELLDRWVEGILWGVTSYKPEEIPLAFCKAVEKLIDGEKDGH